ncbi:MAG: DUF885 domain-containing protein [Gemmataceae bacterium]
MSRVLIAISLCSCVVISLMAAPANDNVAKFVDDYYQALFTWDPNQATAAGIHNFDDKLPDLSQTAHVRRAKELHVFQDRLAKLREGKLSASDAMDAELLDHALKAELLENETVRDWRRNPVTYLGNPAGAIDNLMKRNFASPPERLRSVIGRLRETPSLMQSMKHNVKNPPREFADLGVIVVHGSIGFFRDTLPDWAKTAAGSDHKLLEDFHRANKAALAAMESAQTWIKDEMLPQAKGNYSIGSDAFLKKLQYEEMLDIPLDKLLAIGEANLAKDKADFIATAAKIAPNKTPADVLKELSLNHPSPDDLVPATRGVLERIRQFIVEKHVVTIPSEVRPTVLETPAFQRTGGFASMDTPGAFETKATEAFYYVTPPEKEWDKQRKAEHMAQFNLTGLEVISIHEAYPGHYIQFLYAKQYPTKVRKLYTCGTNVEGWAHYCEQMMLDESYGGGDPKVKLAQLSEALLRDCRYIVGIKLHTQGMTVEEGKKFFMEQGFIEGETAFQEARRGTYNPTYLYYTLGKLQIYKLREDVRRLKGADFNLELFHNEFVKQGGIPAKLMRKIFLGNDAGPSL